MGLRRHEWTEVQRYYDERHTRAECVAHFGFSIQAWTKAVLRGDLKPRKRGCLARPETYAHPRYDWAAVQAFYDAGHSRREITRHFGFWSESWKKAVERGDLKPRSMTVTVEHVVNHFRSRRSVKRRLMQAGVLENRCDECGLAEWRGQPISIQIDHRNGARDDHRLENLRMLCPNCHSQTETYGAKNKNRLPTTT